MWQSIVTTLAYRYFKDDLMELQRYRNTTHSINRWCASNPVASAVTEEIMLVAQGKKPHDEWSFREKLKSLEGK